jgi:hypothetical protein
MHLSFRLLPPLPTQIRASIKVLKMHDNPHLEGLLNALRYTTKHLNDESTPKEVKKMLQA